MKRSASHRAGRRPFAGALVAAALMTGALLLGGCARQHTAAPTGGSVPAAATTAPAAPAKDAGSGSGSGSAKGPAATSTDDVDSLLGDVDKQLSTDDQTPADQD